MEGGNTGRSEIKSYCLARREPDTFRIKVIITTALAKLLG